MFITIGMRRRLILGWFVAGVQFLSMGQNLPRDPAAQGSVDGAGTAPAAALSSVVGLQGDGSFADTSSSLPQIPGLLGGIGISAAFLPEIERSNYLRGGLNVGAGYDDNPLLLSGGAVGNASVSIFPNIKIDETTSRMRWTLGYAGGLTVNQRFTNQNEGSHNLNFDSQYRLSPHVTLHVAESFAMTTGFFDAGNGAEVVSDPGGPNPSLITPLATQKSNNTTVETNYHFALNDLIGAGGSFFDSHFSNAAGAAQLANTQSTSGSAFWLHQLFHRDWGGVAYRFERISFNPGSGDSRVHSLFAMNTWSLSNRMTLTGFIGPQYAENHGLFPGALHPAEADEWSVGGGAELGWRNQTTGLSAGYSRAISDGSGVLGAVRLQTVYANFRRQLTPRWTGALTASHGTNQSLTVPFTTSASSINLTSAGVSLEHNVRNSIGLRFGYSHDFQEQFGVPGASEGGPLQTLNANRNRFFVTLSYQWAKPLGM
jgi:hypothetical protein